MGVFKDITGETSGRLTALRCVGRTKNGKDLWECDCSCGGTTTVDVYRLLSGQTQSCKGCVREMLRARTTGLRKYLDLTGKRFGSLVVQEFAGRRPNGNALFRCICDCGNDTIARSPELRRGRHVSCGCHWSEMFKRRGKAALAFKHGHTTQDEISPTYVTWRAVVTRSTNPKATGHKHYFDAGVTLCERWLNSFEAFLADMGARPAGTTLGRYLDSGAYTKSNCAWQTDAEQKAEAKGKRAMLRFRAWKEQQAQQPILAVAA